MKDEKSPRFHLRQNTNRLTTLDEKSEKSAVRILGTAIGYGRLMQLAQELWRDDLKDMGLEGCEFSIGPCVNDLEKS